MLCVARFLPLVYAFPLIAHINDSLLRDYWGDKNTTFNYSYSSGYQVGVNALIIGCNLIKD